MNEKQSRDAALISVCILAWHADSDKPSVHLLSNWYNPFLFVCLYELVVTPLTFSWIQPLYNVTRYQVEVAERGRRQHRQLSTLSVFSHLSYNSRICLVRFHVKGTYSGLVECCPDVCDSQTVHGWGHITSTGPDAPVCFACTRSYLKL